VLVSGVPFSEINVPSIARGYSDTAIGKILIDNGNATTKALARFARDNSCGPRTFSAGPARNA
jgi:hypothetical protein